MTKLRMFYYDGIPYGETGVRLLEEGHTLSVSPNVRINLADVEILSPSPEDYKKIFEARRK